LALLSSLAVRVDAARELLVTEKMDKYRAWWLEMRRKNGEDPSDEEADRFAVQYRDFARRVVKDGYNPDDEKPIKIIIQADGTLGCSDGNHRLCALAAAGVEFVPVTLGWVSPTWARLLRALGGRIYQPHPHPSFYGWVCTRPDSAARYTEIGRRLVEMGCKSVFEIGPAAGVGVQAMSRAGLAVSWIETDPDYARLCRSLSVVGLPSSQVDALEECSRVDAVVGLAVWHHVATSVLALADAADRMGTAKVQVVELPSPDAPRWHKAYEEEVGTPIRELTAHTLEVIRSPITGAGYYNRCEVLRSESYGGRTTWILWRD